MRRKSKGFRKTSVILQSRIAEAGFSRGFGQTRVLTHWDQICGPTIANISRPLNITYSKHGIGATLNLVCIGANAPVLEMEKENIRKKINAVYGYNAIARVKISQVCYDNAGFGKPSSNQIEQENEIENFSDDFRKKRKFSKEIKDPKLADALEGLACKVFLRLNINSM